MPVLMAVLAEHRNRTRRTLHALRFVHFARFLPTRHNTALVVITEFDGPIRTYVLDFAITLGDLFDAMLTFVKDAPPLPIRDNPEAFLAFVEKNNQIVIRPPDPLVDDDLLFSAYPEATTVDILESNAGSRADEDAWLPQFFENAEAEAVDATDVQGNVLHSRRWGVARHYAVRFQGAARARAFIRSALAAELGDGLGISRDADFGSGGRPELCLTMGLTAHGLRRLGVSPAQLARFPTAFREGPSAPERATAHGDIGDSAPAHWTLGRDSDDVDLLVSLHALPGDAAEARFAAACGHLAAWWPRRAPRTVPSDGGSAGSCADDDALLLVDEIETRALPDGKVHFGFGDGLSQPRIAGQAGGKSGDRAGRHAGDPIRTESPDRQPTVGVGQFLLGDYTDVYGGRSLARLPRGLCNNGTFAVVRVMDQDVAAFERAIASVETDEGRLHPEYVAAKLMGRWRSGRPLTDDAIRLASGPDPDGKPVTRAERASLNAFDYRDPDPDHGRGEPGAGTPDDRRGLICPIGSHVRRMNPRSARVSGKPNSRRILRRGMPYGPAWREGQAPDDVRRGLFGVFVCGDIERQYEFLLRHWGLGDRSAPGIRGTRDPMIATAGGPFLIPRPGKEPLRVDVPSLLKTVGSVYLFMPGIGGLASLAAGSGYEGEPAAAKKVDLLDRATSLSRFDPRDPAFLDDPYPFYARFRAEAPVALVRSGAYRSYWVFTREHIDAVVLDDARFRKPKKMASGLPTGAPRRDDPAVHDQGLFYMDRPRHDQVRPPLDAALCAATRDIEAVARMLADQALRRIPGAQFDLVAAYGRRAARDVFMSLFGVPEPKWDTVGALAETILLNGDPMLPAGEVAQGDVARFGLAAELMQLCPMHRDNPGLFERLHGPDTGLNLMETLLTAAHFVMGGYLSTDFLVGTGIHALVERGLVDDFLALDDEGRRRAIHEMARFEAPFQMADRVTAEEVVLGGVRIPANHLVTVVFGSANRESPDDGDAFRLDRAIDPRSSYAFGRGIHYCIGAGMVDRVAPVLFDRLLAARPRLALAGPAKRLPNPYFRGFASLPLRSLPRLVSGSGSAPTPARG